LLAAGLDGRGAAPQSLRDAFIVRIERLSADAQRVARAVAVARAVDEPGLAAVTGLERDALQTALREAVAEQVLVAVTTSASASVTRCCAKRFTTICCPRAWRAPRRAGQVPGAGPRRRRERRARAQHGDCRPLRGGR